MTLLRSVIAISGAGSGIGQGVARHLASRGAYLSIADLNYEAVDAFARDVRAADGMCLAVRVDVRDTDAVDRWIQQTVDEYGWLDGAVNSAGVRTTFQLLHSVPLPIVPYH